MSVEANIPSVPIVIAAAAPPLPAPAPPPLPASIAALPPVPAAALLPAPVLPVVDEMTDISTLMITRRHEQDLNDID